MLGYVGHYHNYKDYTGKHHLYDSCGITTRAMHLEQYMATYVIRITSYYGNTCIVSIGICTLS